jgi:hypothetical protein
MSLGLISKLVYCCAAPLLDVGAAADIAGAEDFDDVADDFGAGTVSPPHPVTAAPTTRVVAAKPAAVADICFTIGS